MYLLLRVVNVRCRIELNATSFHTDNDLDYSKVWNRRDAISNFYVGRVVVVAVLQSCGRRCVVSTSSNSLWSGDHGRLIDLRSRDHGIWHSAYTALAFCLRVLKRIAYRDSACFLQLTWGTPIPLCRAQSRYRRMLNGYFSFDITNKWNNVKQQTYQLLIYSIFFTSFCY